ncbi:MAG: fucose isomerase [Ruminococcaceae bacterium]|nr:fucose isomerase [Oscillospiraceae bacterium]
MLNKISKIIPPELLYALARMGHGDEIVISDGNFPGESIAASSGAVLVRCDGVGVPELMRAILELMPLDSYDDNMMLMNKMATDADLEIPIWKEYAKIAKENTDRAPVFLERFDFYDRAKKAFCIVVTGESAIYANVILKKGVVKQ